MKTLVERLTRYCLMGFVAALLLCSCEMEASHNGDLDGFWLLTQVDTLSNQHSHPCREELRFWSFQGNLMSTQQLLVVAESTCYFYRFNHEGKRLLVTEPHEYNRMEGNLPIGDDRLSELAPFGINHSEESFAVEKLNRKHMQLTSETLRLHFEKY